MFVLPRRIPALTMRWIPSLAVFGVLMASLAVLTLEMWPLPAAEAPVNVAGDAKRGAYLARLAGCVTCHTAPGTASMSGGAALTSRFGAFYAPNITPDPTYGIGAWTVEQFARAVRQGVSPDNAPYYPAFPYEFYSSLTDRDVADLWAALRAVPAVASPSRPNEVGFPFNIRDGLKVWRTFFERPFVYREEPQRSVSWNRGRYMVLGPAHCGACHTPRNPVGGLAPEQSLTGDPSMQDGGLSPSLIREDLIARGWTKESLVSALRTGVLPDGDTFGGSMAEVVHGSTGLLLTQHLEDMAAYLLNSSE